MASAPDPIPPEPPKGSKDFERFKELTRRLLAVPKGEAPKKGKAKAKMGNSVKGTRKRK